MLYVGMCIVWHICVGGVCDMYMPLVTYFSLAFVNPKL